MTLPGSAVGAGGALTVGVKELAPPGDTAFSVGDGAGALVDVVGVVLSGAFSARITAGGQRAHADDREPASTKRNPSSQTT